MLKNLWEFAWMLRVACIWFLDFDARGEWSPPHSRQLSHTWCLWWWWRGDAMMVTTAVCSCMHAAEFNWILNSPGGPTHKTPPFTADLIMCANEIICIKVIAFSGGYCLHERCLCDFNATRCCCRKWPCSFWPNCKLYICIANDLGINKIP